MKTLWTVLWMAVAAPLLSSLLVTSAAAKKIDWRGIADEVLDTKKNEPPPPVTPQLPSSVQANPVQANPVQPKPVQPKPGQPGAVVGKSTVAPCAMAVAAAPLTVTETIKARLAKATVDEIGKALLKIDDIQIPKSIDDVCQATKRLTYVERYTARWSMSVIDAIKQSKQALELAGEAASYAAFTNNPDFAHTGHDAMSAMQKDMKKDLAEIETAIADKRAANQEKLNEANANLRSALAQGSIIAGWDKVLVDFIGDNTRWALIENSKSVLLLKDHVGLLGSTASAIRGVMKAHSASSLESVDKASEKKSAAILKQREQENVEYEKTLTAELQL